MDAAQNELQAALLAHVVIAGQTTAVILAAEFTLIFGYLAALYLFLRFQGIWVRTAAYIFAAGANLFMGFGHFGTQIAQYRWLDWRQASIRNGSLPSYWTLDSGEAYASLLDISDYLIAFLVLGSTVLMFIATFLYRWRSTFDATGESPEPDGA